MGVCETFLNESVDDKTLHIDGYTFERKDRDACTATDSKNGGGIVVYIRDNINYTRRIDLETSDIESVWLEFNLKNSKSFLFCSVYRPPSSKSEWIDTFFLQIEKSLLLNNEIYIAGDLNIDFKDGNAANNKWKHVIETHDLSQHINTPTRVTAHSEIIIDHVNASDSAYMTDISVPYIVVSNHYPVLFTRATTNVHFKRQEHISIQYRTSNQFDDDSFLDDLSEQMNTLVISQTDINAIFF